MSEGISIRLADLELTAYDAETINRTLENILAFNPINGPDSITLITDDKNLEISVASPDLRGMKVPRIPSETLEKLRGQRESQTIVQECEKGDLVRSVRAVVIGKNQANKAVLITSLLIKEETLSQMTAISQGIEGYKQLK
jgi:hypothetical protein